MSTALQRFTSVCLPGREKRLPTLILAFFGVVYFTISASNHYYFRSFCFDYGTYNQMFYQYAHGKMNSTVYEPQLDNFLQTHLTLTLMVLSPLYWVLKWFMGTYALFFIQTGFILSGGYAVWLLVKKRSGNELLAALFMLHYFVIQGHFSALAADYSDTIVGSSIVPWFVYFIDQRKFGKATIAFLFIIFAKENMPFWMGFISIALMILYRDDKQVVRKNALFLVVSWSYFFLLYPSLMKMIDTQGVYSRIFLYSSLGDNIYEALMHVVKHPIDTFQLLYENRTGNPQFDGIKAEFYEVFFLSGAIALIFRPYLFIVFVPIIAQKVFNDDMLRWGINSYYSIEIASSLSVFIFLALDIFYSKKFQVLLGIALVVGTANLTLDKLKARTSLWYDPVKENIFSKEMFQTKLNLDDIYRGLSTIPDDAFVSATENLVPHLAYRPQITCFPWLHGANYIALLKHSSTYPLTAEQFEKESAYYLYSPSWERIYEGPEIVVLKERNQSSHEK